MMTLNYNEKDFQKKLQKDIEMPEIVHEHINQAYRLIENNAVLQKKASKDPYHWMKSGGRIAGGMAAVLAVGFVFCAINPVMAKNIPVVGGLFEILQDNVSFFGDFSDHATTLEAVDGTKTDSSETDGAKTDHTNNDAIYTKTADGLTITCSEVYANSQAIYVTMQFKSDKPFPETETGAESGTPVIDLDMTGGVDFNSEASPVIDGQVEGKFLDDNTYAGVLRIPVEDMTVDEAGWTKFYEVRNAFFKEKGIDVDSEDFSFDKLAQALGMDEYSDAKLPQVGGPAISDYVKDIKVPDRFTMELDLKDIVGTLPENQDTTPDIPQDLRDEYSQKMEEHGISTDDADYESLTEEQKNLEHQFFTEMWNEYYERYPEANEGDNRYNSWTLKGDWKFNVDVEKNTSDTVEKDVNVVDENGDGVLSITKTPFEITMKMQDPETKYVAVMLDANGDIMPYGGVANSNADTYAIQDRDVSTVYIYLCDYYEYMDELKGYYWSDDYEEKAKTKTFKQLLDERAVAGTEVHFDTDK